MNPASNEGPVGGPPSGAGRLAEREGLIRVIVSSGRTLYDPLPLPFRLLFCDPESADGDAGRELGRDAG